MKESPRITVRLADDNAPVREGVRARLADDNAPVREGVRALFAVETDFEIVGGTDPPRLRDRGLGEALVNTASRSRVPTTVLADGVGRYDTDIEVRDDGTGFDTATADSGSGLVNMRDRLGTSDNGVLWFEVRDDGTGFEVASGLGRGTTVSGTAPITGPKGPTHDAMDIALDA